MFSCLPVSRSTADDIQRELTGLRDQQDRLLNLRLLDEIEPATFARKNTELRDRIATLTLKLESAHRRRDERAELAQKVFELSQRLTGRWVAADYGEKRQILEMVCLNFTLDGATLVPTMRKPFDILVEGLSVSSSRSNGTPVELFLRLCFKNAVFAKTSHAPSECRPL